MKRIGILSDTHGYLHPKIYDFFADCDEIWHAGDIVGQNIITDLEAIATVRAVYGNCDGWEYRSQIPENNIFTCEGFTVMIRHILGRPNHYEPEAQKVIEQVKPTILIGGHSHILCIKQDKINNLLFINPGSAGKQGIHTRLTFVRLKIDHKSIQDIEVWDEPKTTSIH